MNMSESMDSSVQYFQGCPEEHLLVQFDRGEVSAQLIVPVSDHVGQCAKCQARIEKFQPDDFQSSLVAAIELDSDITDSQASREELSRKESKIDDMIEKFRQQVPGQEIAESKKTKRFEISKFIGNGQFGEVHLAYDHQFRHAVALKITGEDVTYNANQLKTFLADVERMQRLSHPGIVKVNDFGRWSGNRAFLTMPLIDGVSLSRWFAGKTVRPIRSSMKLFHKIIDVIEFLHGERYLHRNLKPSNIFVHRDHSVVLTDVGLFVDERYLEFRPQYDPKFFRFHPPEQLKFEGHRMNASSDIYSLGRILELILERSHSRSDSGHQQFLNPLRNISKKCTATIQSERFQSVTELRQALIELDF